MSSRKNLKLNLNFLGGVVVLPLLLCSCGTSYEATANKAWSMMKQGQAEQAVQLYEKEVNGDKEKLLQLMDEGILYRVAKKFEESNEKFFAAAKIIEMNGYLALGEQAVTLVSNEKQTTYQGEDFEKVLVHLYLGLNFLSLKKYESALVESRKVNEILYKMISEAKRPYELNAFAKYLGGVLFEADHDDNNALVSYQATLKMNPSLAETFPALAQDLMRVAKRNGMTHELDEFQKKFGMDIWEKAKKSLESQMGSVVVFYESGKSPEKFSSNEKRVTTGRGGTSVDVMIPIAYYKKRGTAIRAVKIRVNGVSAKSAVLNDIEQTAIQHLNDRMGRQIAKALLTAGVKAGIATGVGVATKSKELGLLTGLALFLASEADTRSWLLLPAELQVAKVFVPAGRYDLNIAYLSSNGESMREETIPQIEVKSNRPTFIQVRSFD